MKKQKTELTSKVFHIKPWVLFRPTNLLTTRATPPFGIQVKNNQDQAFYEFKGRAAYIWLSVDGIRNVEEVIRNSKKWGAIKDPNFPALARKFLKDLVESGLLAENTSGFKEKRISDMEAFLQHIRRSTKKRKKLSRPLFKPPRPEPGDRLKLQNVRENFSKLLKCNIRFKVKRYSPSAYGGRYHIFSADVSLPGQRQDMPGFGAALTVEGAAMAAVGEAIERFFSFGTRPDIIGKSYGDLGGLKRKALDPESFKFFSSNQDILRNHEVLNLTRKTKINWTWFENATSPGKKTLIPAEINAADSSGEIPVFFGETTSSGCAAGIDPDSARVKAALEFIERDGLVFYWRTKNTPQLIDLAHPNERLERLIDMLGPWNKKIKLFYLKSELSPVTVQAVFLGDQRLGEPLFASTCASRMDVVDAIEKAVIELLYVVSGLVTSGADPAIFYGRNFDNSIWDFGDRAKLYSWYPSKEAYGFLFPRNPSKISYSDIPHSKSTDYGQHLKVLASDFRRHGLRFFYRNNTPINIQKAGFWIYRAFSPDMFLVDGVHRYRQLACPRYYKLPATLRLKRRPKLPEELNPWPHPLP